MRGFSHEKNTFISYIVKFFHTDIMNNSKVTIKNVAQDWNVEWLTHKSEWAVDNYIYKSRVEIIWVILPTQKPKKREAQTHCCQHQAKVQTKSKPNSGYAGVRLSLAKNGLNFFFLLYVDFCCCCFSSYFF